jgi:hypothetical protein
VVDNLVSFKRFLAKAEGVIREAKQTSRKAFISPNFLTCFSPVIFSCFATRWLWLLNQADSKTVLWQQVSHLLLKYTKLGYETVLTAACARQGCSATE